MRALLLLALLAYATAYLINTPTSPLVGTWQNELGSQMVIQSANGGLLTGQYTSKVGSGSTSPLYGSYSDDNLVLSFSVNWSTVNSTTAWAGQLREDGKIHTTWLLVTQSDSLNDLWSSTRVGKDIFWPVGK